MSKEVTRLTFVVTEEMEPLLAWAKKNFFYDCSQSTMIRELIMAGLDTLEEGAGKSRPVTEGFETSDPAAKPEV